MGDNPGAVCMAAKPFRLYIGELLSNSNTCTQAKRKAGCISNTRKQNWISECNLFTTEKLLPLGENKPKYASPIDQLYLIWYKNVSKYQTWHWKSEKKQRFCRDGCEGTAPALLLPMLHVDPLPLLSPCCCTASRGGCTDPVSTKATENTLQMPLSTPLSQQWPSALPINAP